MVRSFITATNGSLKAYSEHQMVAHMETMAINGLWGVQIRVQKRIGGLCHFQEHILDFQLCFRLLSGQFLFFIWFSSSSGTFLILMLESPFILGWVFLKLRNDRVRLTVTKNWLIADSSEALEWSSFKASSSLGYALTIKLLGLRFSEENSGN